MEKVSAMKKIALFMMIVGLAVALVACQGAVGPAGKDGVTGPQGPLGPPGQLGPEGPTPLVAKTGLGPVLLVNDIKKADGTVTVGGPKTFDIASEFSGGVGVTYKAVKSTGDADLTPSEYEISLTGSMLTVTLTSAPTLLAKTWTEPMFSTPDNGEMPMFTKGKDALEVVLSATSGGVTTTRSLYVVRNQAPRSDVGANGIGLIDFVRLGSQDAPRDAFYPHKDWVETDSTVANAWPDADSMMNDFIKCSKLNVCTITPVTVDDTSVHFMDDGELSYTATTDKPNVQAASTPDGKSIILTGVTTTVTAAGANTFVTEGVTVTVTATDKGGLFSTNYLKVIVDDGPSGVSTLPTSFEIPAAGTETMITIPLGPFVKDSEGGTLTFFLADASRATNNFATATVQSGGLVVTAGAFKGSRTFTIRAYEPIVGHAAGEANGGVGQWYDFTLTVNNKRGL